jgi:hypothetical protein
MVSANQVGMSREAESLASSDQFHAWLVALFLYTIIYICTTALSSASSNVHVV